MLRKVAHVCSRHLHFLPAVELAAPATAAEYERLRPRAADRPPL